MSTPAATGETQFKFYNGTNMMEETPGMAKKLPVRLFQPLFGLFMAIFMSFLMSGAITALNIGFPADFISRWMHSWGMAFVIAYPVILVVAPMARRLALQFVESPFASNVQVPTALAEAKTR